MMFRKHEYKEKNNWGYKELHVTCRDESKSYPWEVSCITKSSALSIGTISLGGITKKLNSVRKSMNLNVGIATIKNEA